MMMKVGKLQLGPMLIAAAVTLVLITGCATPPPKAFIIKHYQDAEQPIEKVALVIATFRHKFGTIKVSSISEGIGMDGGNGIHHPYVLLKPGQYTFDLDCIVGTPMTVTVVEGIPLIAGGQPEIIGIPVSRTKDVKAGHVYYLTGRINLKDNRWRAIVKEIDASDIADSGNKELINGYALVKTNYHNAATTKAMP